MAKKPRPRAPKARADALRLNEPDHFDLYVFDEHGKSQLDIRTESAEHARTWGAKLAACFYRVDLWLERGWHAKPIFEWVRGIGTEVTRPKGFGGFGLLHPPGEAERSDRARERVEQEFQREELGRKLLRRIADVEADAAANEEARRTAILDRDEIEARAEFLAELELGNGALWADLDPKVKADYRVKAAIEIAERNELAARAERAKAELASAKRPPRRRGGR